MFKGPDWHTPHIPVWKQMLAPLKDKKAHCLEIGSYEGRSAKWLLEFLPDCTLTCVDPFIEDQEQDGSLAPTIKGREAIFDKMVMSFNSPDARSEGEMRVVKRTGKSKGWLLTIHQGGDRSPYESGEQYDFIYVDGSHLGPDVLFDAVLSFELLKPGGLLCFDDFVWCNDQRDLDPTSAPRLPIMWFIEVNAKRLEILHEGVQAWIRKKA